jgi:two-component system response regulator (stage 0 sporulation protein A)
MKPLTNSSDDSAASMPDLNLVSKVLREIGIPVHNRGYRLLRDAILLALEKPETLFAVSRLLYPPVAERYGSSSKSVERAIGRAIEIAWERGEKDVLQKYFNIFALPAGYKPTTKEFIAHIVDMIRLQKK